MNKTHPMIALGVLAAAFLFPVVLPTTFLGETLEYVKNEVKSDTEVAAQQRREKIEDRSESVSREKEDTSDDSSQDNTSRGSKSSRSSRSNDRSDRGDVLGVTTGQGERGTISVYKFVGGTPATTQNIGDDSFAMMAHYGDESSTHESQNMVSYTLDSNNDYVWTNDRSVETSFSTYEVLNDQDAESRVFTAETCAQACPADFNQDGMVDAFDLSILLDNWALNPSDGPVLGDLNADSIVNAADLGTLLGEWGPCAAAYKLDGYSVAPTYEEASRGITTRTAPVLSATDEDQVVIVWNSLCEDRPKIAMCEAGVNIIENGSFEDVDVQNDSWDIFDVNDGIGWVVAWVGGSTEYQDAARPSPAKIEIQAGVFGWNSAQGVQHAELDTDWDGPEGSLGGEPASVKIYQDIATIPGMQYELAYDFAARPGMGTADNMLLVNAGDVFVATTTAVAENDDLQPQWSTITSVFTATASTTRISFTDLGSPNSLGTLLDDVSLTCLPQKDTDTDGDQDTNTGEENTTDEDGDDGEGEIAGNENDNDGNGGGNGGSSRSGGSVLGASTSIGDVLGAYTCNDPYLKEYIKYGKNNSVEEVKKLQTFLNKYQGANLPVTGFYGPATRDAVNKFQTFHNMFVLRPWMQAGYTDNDTTPTGYVYQTTRRWINLLECPVLSLPMPELVVDTVAQ